MSMKFVALVTLLPMLVHSIFGCCWHHAHCEQMEASPTANSHNEAHSHQCGHHHYSENVNTEGRTSQVPAPFEQHEPCEDGRCVFLTASSLRIAFASELMADFVVPEADCVGASCDSQTSLSCQGASRDLPTPQQHCALIQVWIV